MAAAVFGMAFMCVVQRDWIRTKNRSLFRIPGLSVTLTDSLSVPGMAVAVCWAPVSSVQSDRLAEVQIVKLKLVSDFLRRV